MKKILKKKVNIYFSSLIIIASFSCKQDTHESNAPQPYAFLQAEKTGEKVPHSPDPLVNWQWDDPKASDSLEIYYLRPVKIEFDQKEHFQLKLHTKKATEIKVTGSGSIRFDFGQVNAAWLEFDSKNMNGKVKMSISEYNEPAILNKGAQNPMKTLTPVKYDNTYRLELNDELYEGVRYGWIHVEDFKKSWHIEDVRLVCQIKPTNYKGSFYSNDTLLSRIWYAGAYGVKLNLLQDHFGAILMERSDRHSWTGDAYVSQTASLVAFGNYDFIKQNIDYTSTQDQGIPSYSLYWIHGLYDYFYYTGDTATVRKYIDNAVNKLDNAYDHFGKNPKQRFYGWDERLGAGFENPQIDEVQNAYKMLSISSWMKFSKMMNAIGEAALADKYEGYAKEKINFLRQDKDWYSDYGIHAAAEAINTGLTTTEELKDIYKNEFTNRLNNISYSPFNQYFIINAMAGMNKYDEALTTIRDCWGGQIKYGGTTFFEVYRPSWNQVLGYNDAPPNNQCGYTSMCHPWGGGVVKWLTEEILGIQPIKPGFTACRITPNPGRTITHVKGNAPTPKGIIGVEVDVDKGLLNVSIPEGIEAKLGFPKVEKEIKAIHLKNQEIWKNQKAISKNFFDKASEDEQYVYLTGVKAGDYNFKIEYNGHTPAYSEKEWIYPADFIGKDTVTSGDFGGIYGKDGYILFSHTKTKDTVTNYQKLPGYVSSISCNKTNPVNWENNSMDSRALAASGNNEFPRSIGAILTRNPVPCDQTMTVDIATKDTKEYQVALYFVDWKNEGMRTAVEIFDLQTKELIAPVQVIRDYSQGKYLIYRYNKPVRFRINHVRGPNASLSGLFFDAVE